MAFPPARNPRSGKQYKHRTRKKIKIISLILYPFILKSKVFHCYENGSTKNLMSLWLYKVYICTKGKVKWNGSVILRHSRPHSFSFLICALSSSVKSSARLSSALICSELFPMIRLATTCTMIVPLQWNVYWRLRRAFSYTIYLKTIWCLSSFAGKPQSDFHRREILPVLSCVIP